jgi:hypothetical protein
LQSLLEALDFQGFLSKIQDACVCIPSNSWILDFPCAPVPMQDCFRFGRTFPLLFVCRRVWQRIVSFHWPSRMGACPNRACRLSGHKHLPMQNCIWPFGTCPECI